MQKILVALAALVSLAAAARAQDNGNAPAAAPAAAPAENNGGGDTQWQKNHPRREQVNERLQKNVADGDITKGQAARDLREERRMAAKDGGHITKRDQRRLNRRIDRQKARDKKAKQ